MGFAGEHDLHMAPLRREQPDEAVGVSENKLGSFICGEAPGEPDCQRTRIEERAGGNDGRGADVFLSPTIAGALTDEREQKPFQGGARVPQLLV